MFKVYKRKINVFYKPQPDTRVWIYAWSTNAYPTCKAAVAGAKDKHPELEFKAFFAK